MKVMVKKVVFFNHEVVFFKRKCFISKIKETTCLGNMSTSELEYYWLLRINFNIVENKGPKPIILKI